MVNFFARKIHFTSAADAPSPSDFVCHLRLRGGRAPFVALRHFPRFIGDICPFRGRAYPRWESKRNIVFYNKKDYIFIFFRKICSLFLCFLMPRYLFLQHFFGVVFVRLHICLCLIKTRNNRLIRRLIVVKTYIMPYFSRVKIASFIRVSFRIRSSFASSHSRILLTRRRLYGNIRSRLPRVFQDRFSAL